MHRPEGDSKKTCCSRDLRKFSFVCNSKLFFLDELGFSVNKILDTSCIFSPTMHKKGKVGGDRSCSKLSRIQFQTSNKLTVRSHEYGCKETVDFQVHHMLIILGIIII